VDRTEVLGARLRGCAARLSNGRVTLDQLRTVDSRSLAEAAGCLAGGDDGEHLRRAVDPV
jgi:hypothetical protein